MGKEGDVYEIMATETEELDVSFEDEEDIGEGRTKTLTSRIDENPNLSDMQVASIKLFPDDLGNYIVNKLMVARIFPDSFSPLLHLMVKAEIAQSDPSKPIYVEMIIAKIYILMTIGVDGKGRIDELELAGAARDDEESDKLSKMLG